MFSSCIICGVQAMLPSGINSVPPEGTVFDSDVVDVNDPLEMQSPFRRDCQGIPAGIRALEKVICSAASWPVLCSQDIG
jgi:hypothetical protein